MPEKKDPRFALSAAPMRTGAPTPLNIPEDMETFPPTLDLPPDHLEMIGKIVVHWAYEEWFLAGLIDSIIGIGRKEGRIVFAGGRVPDAVTKIRQLCEVRGLNVSSALLEQVAKAVRAADGSRNLVGHAVWAKDHEGALLAQDPSGEWKIEGEKSVSKRRYPEGVLVDLDVLTAKFNDVLRAIELTKQLGEELSKQLGKEMDALERASNAVNAAFRTIE